MSAIDQYTYTALGLIECPVPYRFFHTQADIQPIYVGIYRLRQNIPEDEKDFQGKLGDILVGGGGGEAPAMCICIPEAIIFYTDLNRYDREYPDHQTETFVTYWNPTQAYMLGSGYETLGWNPEDEAIGHWLTKHVLSFLLKNYSADYVQFAGADYLEHDGSICRNLTEEEDKGFNWKTYKYGFKP